MNDIKFACPHCSQHIVCDADYANLSIECPSCSGTMAVPRLAPSPSVADAMVVVASTTPPTPRPTQTIPPIDVWSERRWAEQFSNETEEHPALAALWLGILFITVVSAFVLVTHRSGIGSIAGCLLLGGALAGFVRAMSVRNSMAASLVSSVLFAAAMVVLVPVVAVGILFVGCTACAK